MNHFKLSCALLLAAALGGCGGSSNYSSTSATMPTPAPAAETAFTQVSKAAAAMPDDAEPANVDAVVLAASDDTEPTAL